jgi:hypothetical protein
LTSFIMTQRTWLSAVLSGLLLLAAVPRLAAFDVKVTANKTQVQLGEPAVVTVQVRACNEKPHFALPDVDGCTIVPAGQGASRPSLLGGMPATGRLGQLGNFNGDLFIQDLIDSMRKLAQQADPKGADPQALPLPPQAKDALAKLNQNDYTFQFHIQASRPGTYTVPGFTVTADNQKAVTPSIDLTVTEPRPQNWVRVETSVSNPKARAGEEVSLSVDVWIRRTQLPGRGGVWQHFPVQNVWITLPPFRDNPAVKLAVPPDVLAADRPVRPGKFDAFHLGGVAPPLRLDREPADPDHKGPGPAWYRFRLPVSLRLRREGPAEVGPVRVAGEVYVPALDKARQAWVARGGRWESFSAASKPVKLDVGKSLNPLPPEPATKKPTAEKKAAGKKDRPAARADLPPLYDGDAALAGDGLGPPGLPLVVGTLVLPPAVVLLLWGLGIFRRRHAAVVEERQRHQAAAEVRSQLHTPAPTAAGVRQLLADFLRARFQMPPGEITPHDAAERLREAGIHTRLSREFAELLEHCVAAEFAPGLMAASGADLAVRADRLIQAVERLGVPV